MNQERDWRNWLYRPTELLPTDLDRRASWAAVAVPSKKRCENATEVDYAALLEEWISFLSALRHCGTQLICAEDDDSFANQVFIGDHLRLFNDILVLGQMKSLLRQQEQKRIVKALQRFVPADKWFSVTEVDGNAVLEHGDTLVLGNRVFLGRSGRTNDAGSRALAKILGNFGWRVVPVSFDARVVTHLTGGASEISEDVVAINPDIVEPEVFHKAGLEVLEVPPQEPLAIASFWLRTTKSQRVVIPAECPRWAELLDQRGLGIVESPLATISAYQGVPGALCAYLHSVN